MSTPKPPPPHPPGHPDALAPDADPDEPAREQAAFEEGRKHRDRRMREALAAELDKHESLKKAAGDGK